MLWMLRSIAKGERAGWLNSMVLMIDPIYNADGNERVNVTNRGSQFGPVGGMGTRENAKRPGSESRLREARNSRGPVAGDDAQSLRPACRD